MAQILAGGIYRHREDESLNGTLRDEFMNGEIFCTATEEKVVIETWLGHYNTTRPRNSLGCWPQVPATIVVLVPGRRGRGTEFSD